MNNQQTPDTRFASLLHRAASTGQLKKAVFSKPPKGADVVRAVASVTAVRGTPHLQLETFHTDNKAKHLNLPLGDETAFAEALIAATACFGHANLLTQAGDCELLRAGSGKVTLLRGDALHKALAAAAPSEIALPTARKAYILDGSESFLRALDVSDRNGRVYDKKQAKFRQINRFLELLRDVEKHLPTEGTLHVLDLCCGKSYLSFAVYHYLTVVCGRQVVNYRTRMTHTLEVTQIARIIARALRLNEDLCEAAALGHDLGHTPFGHAGEQVMQKCYSHDFTHYRQSLRVVEKLENNGAGLNLTYEVRDAIVNHTGDNMASTLEGIIIKYADRIAYINHDIDDARRAGILSLYDIPKEIREVLGDGHGERINKMVSSIIDASTESPFIRMTPDVQKATDELRKFLFENVYTNPIAKGEETKAKEMLARLFEYFVKNPDKMPAPYSTNLKNESVERCVCDYVSAMTDRNAIELYTDLFIPKVWRGKS